MKNLVIYSLLFMLFFVSCNQSSKKETNLAINIKDSLIVNSDTLSANSKWMKAINDKNIDLLSSLYTENAKVLSENGVDLKNRDEILELVPKSDFVVKSVSTTKRIQANNAYDYEIGGFVNKDDGIAKHLIIWKTTGGNDIRELEFITEVSGASPNIDDIDVQRTKWMLLCNAHDAKSLIDKMYSKNTMYYNRGRLLKGRNDLVAEYQYMNNPQYKLALEPILVEPVSEDIVYEFGQCKGSYNGKYILVWKKNPEGVWQILFDSNI